MPCLYWMIETDVLRVLTAQILILIHGFTGNAINVYGTAVIKDIEEAGYIFRCGTGTAPGFEHPTRDARLVTPHLRNGTPCSGQRRVNLSGIPRHVTQRDDYRSFDTFRKGAT